MRGSSSRPRRGPGRGIAASVAAIVLLHACTSGERTRGGAWFDDETPSLGLPAPPESWPDGNYFMPEIMQGGVGLFDYDGDGALDLVHVRIPPPGGKETGITNRLYHQEQDGRFADVSAAMGLGAVGFGQGLAVGDLDNDGDLDLYVANYGPDVLYRNDEGKKLSDVSAAAGLQGDWWSTAVAFGDYDADGFLDLYVVHYVRYDPGKRCTDPSDRKDYCGPRSFNGAPDTLYHNDGDGTFTDRTREAGIVLPQEDSRGTGLGVLFTDLTRDGRPDIFVANDAQANQLWVNQGEGRFGDEGILRGVALDRNGRPEANMGVAAGDVNGDGELDLFVTHLWQENNRLYLGSPGAQFRDHTIEAHLARYDRTGFGCGLYDFDHDGDVDLAIANGAVRRRPPLPGGPQGFWADYVEPNQVYENDGHAVFTEVDDKAGPFASRLGVGRGLAFGDIDSDGDVDMVLSRIDNSLSVFRNHAPAAGTHWARVRALAHERDDLGAQVRLRAGGREFLALAVAASSYGSSNDPRAHFGLGALAAVDEIVVQWTDGRVESFPGTGVDQDIVLRQGGGKRP